MWDISRSLNTTMPAPDLYEASDWEQDRVRRVVAALSVIAERLEECLDDPKLVGPDFAPSSDDVRSLARAARKALDEYSAPHPYPVSGEDPK